MIKCINLKNPEKFRMFPDHLANNAKFLKDHGWMIAPAIDDSPIDNSCCLCDSALPDYSIFDPCANYAEIKPKRKYASYKNKNKTTN